MELSADWSKPRLEPLSFRRIVYIVQNTTFRIAKSVTKSNHSERTYLSSKYYVYLNCLALFMLNTT